MLSYKKYNFRIRPKEKIILPGYKGSAFRGGFGVAFRRVTCALKRNECLDCSLNKTCVYSYVFETFSFEKVCKIFDGSFSKDIPRPFVIEPPVEEKTDYNSDEIIEFGVILIGKAVEYLPYFIYSFELLGKEIGIGKKRGKFEVVDVCSDDNVVYKDGVLNNVKEDVFYIDVDKKGVSKIDSVKLTILTPLRIFEKRRLAKDISFEIFFKTLHRRLVLLAYYHCGLKQLDYDYRSLIENSEKITKGESNLRWYDWERYSLRKGIRMSLGGFVGELSFEGDLTPFIDFLRAGEILHVGKGVVFGMGKYKVSFI